MVAAERRPLVIAHRGASAEWPENTVAAFSAAAAAGADGVELDVRRTANGTLAISHDETLPDGRALLGLRRTDLPPAMPDLAAALDACAGMLVNIEIKNFPGDGDFDPGERLAAAVVELLDARAGRDRVLISGFHLGTVNRVRALDPRLSTGLLTSDPQPAGLVEGVAAAGHVAIHPLWSTVDRDVVDAAHAAGLRVNVWTVDAPADIRALAAAGVDAVITNDPASALRTLAG